MQSRPFYCHDCGGSSGYRSRPRGFFEKFVLPVFMLRPVRCADCFRRDYVSIFIDVRQRDHPAAGPRAVA